MLDQCMQTVKRRRNQKACIKGWEIMSANVGTCPMWVEGHFCSIDLVTWRLRHALFFMQRCQTNQLQLVNQTVRGERKQQTGGMLR